MELDRKARQQPSSLVQYETWFPRAKPGSNIVLEFRFGGNQQLNENFMALSEHTVWDGPQDRLLLKSRQL